MFWANSSPETRWVPCPSAMVRANPDVVTLKLHGAMSGCIPADQTNPISMMCFYGHADVSECCVSRELSSFGSGESSLLGRQEPVAATPMLPLGAAGRRLLVRFNRYAVKAKELHLLTTQAAARMGCER